MRLSLISPTHIFKQSWGRPDAFRAYTLKQRLKLLCLTAACGSIANLEVALANAGLAANSNLIEAAAEAGQLDACKMLRARGFSWGDSLAAAARGGHRHVCEWLLTSGCSFRPAAVNAAARSGHECLMNWLMAHQVVHPTDVGSLLCDAAAGLSLAVFQRLKQQLLTGQRQAGEAQQQQQPEEVISEDQRGSVLAAAAGSSTPDWQAKVEWLEGLGYPRTHRACASAAACSPDEEVASRLQWLRSRGYPPDAEAVKAAAARGNLSALRFLVEQAGVLSSWHVTYSAVCNGHLAVLQYLHTSGGLLWEPQYLACFAAEKGHLPVVAWVVEALGVTPVNAAFLLTLAAESGSLELMTWLRDRGWTWDRATISNAARSGCEEAVEWLVEQGCPCPEDGSAYLRATGRGDLAMIRCLHRLG